MTEHYYLCNLLCSITFVIYCVVLGDFELSFLRDSLTWTQYIFISFCSIFWLVSSTMINSTSIMKFVLEKNQWPFIFFKKLFLYSM